MSAFKLLCAALFLGLTTWALNISADKPTHVGTFEVPSARVRPRFRYWLPDPGVNKTLLAEDIKAAGDIGAGGIEFLPFYGYGGVIDTYIPAANWSKNGFGTPAFLDAFRVALKAHKDHDMVMDFALGPNQGQGVPAESTDEGLQWDLVPHYSRVPENGSFTGTIPGWGEGELVALVFAEASAETNVSIPGSSLQPPEYTSYIRLTLSFGSLKDLTTQVTSSGHVAFNFGAPVNRARFWLFAFYEKQTLVKNLDFPYNDTRTIFDNGSYTVDHFSAAGAKVVENFWKSHILDSNVRELLADVGNYAWEDSMELTSHINWTPAIPAKFEQKYGYSIRLFLPLIMWGNNNIGLQPSDPGQVQCLLDTEDGGQGYMNDYRELLQDCYREYLEELRRWVHEDLGLQTSSQVSYNMPMDTAVNVPFSDAPECESLGFDNNVDSYLQFSGAAHFAGRRVVSNEMGAERNKAYQLTIPRLTWSVNRAVVGGVNQVIIHGQAFSGNYYNTTWPGYTPFSYLFSEIFTNKQPSWNHGLAEAMGYMARVQFVQQQGIPRTDIAIYNKVSTRISGIAMPYQLDILVKDGWTYEYLTADNFHLPQAHVKDNVLAPDGPRYKALVLPESSNLTLEATLKLKSFAEAGLPIIFSGNAHGYYSSGNNSDRNSVESAISNLLESENVHSCESQHLVQLLSSIGLSPQIRTETNGTLYSTWREDETEGLDYAFLFCDGSPCRGRIYVSTTKVPYILDPWTGDKAPLFVFSVENNKTVLPINLKGNQTQIIAFAENTLDGAIRPTFHATSVPPNLLGYKYESPSKVHLHLGVLQSESQPSLTLSTGRSLQLSNASTLLSSLPLRNWTLTAEHWEAPSNISDATTIAHKHNSTHYLTTLAPWTQIPGLENASGIGYYHTSFPWPPTNSSATDGAYIRFSHVLHAITVYVNSNQLPPIDSSAADVDIGPYLCPGQDNEVLVVTPTTMWNYLRSIFGRIENVGEPPLLELLSQLQGGELPPSVEAGMVGEVEVVPYARYKVEM
ncbi:hypothetical protein BFW01_g10327 [Lasiodiplodia theobromae]|uniref:Secreted protein n=1 Tax=Lasiodiplodia theobromae TaxID=45133 RepID=A0A8H7MA47_9PEZI|nr:hypothetical protein BFW01_g10327 [Lasiodiplodia theobromae]